jgi:hypothetical protein
MNRPRALLRLLLSLVAGYLLLVALAWAFQGQFIHFPLRELAATPADAGLSYREEWITTTDGERLHGWFLPAPRARASLLFLHGNAGNISHRLDSLRVFHRLGLNVLLFDYRGYGRSSGSPSEEGLARDAEAGYVHLLRQPEVDKRRILLFGRSLGAAVAARLATQRPIAALIVESGFTSLPDIAAEIYPFLPVRIIARYTYDTRGALRQVRAPVLVVHSRDDDIIPFHHGQALYAAANAPRAFLEISGDHNRGFIDSGARYVNGLAAFLERHFGP